MPPRPSSLHRALRAWGHQGWLRFGVRDRLIRALVSPDKHSLVSFEVPFFEHRYAGSFDSFIDWSVYFYGAYERDEVILLRRLARPGAVMLDVGANVGHHALALASLCSAIHAFEPFSPVRELMAAQLARNGIRNVHVHPVGLADRDAELPFFAPPGTNRGIGSFVAATGDAGGDERLRVVQGDAYLRERGIRGVDLVKIDVEGFEKQVLEGLQRTLAESRPLLLVEFSGATRAAFGTEDALRRVLPRDYRYWLIRKPKPVMALLSPDGVELQPLDFGSDEGNLVVAPHEAGDLSSLLQRGDRRNA